MQEELFQEVLLGDMICSSDHAKRRFTSRKQVKQTQTVTFQCPEKKKTLQNKWERKLWKKTPNQEAKKHLELYLKKITVEVQVNWMSH